MPFSVSAGTRIYWKLEGEESARGLVLLNSIGTDMDLWDAALPALRKSFRLLRIDTRGHGASDAPAGDYTLAELAGDVFGVMDHAGLAEAAIAGVSLGGMIAMEMAMTQPGRISRLALICTSATMDPGAWNDRITKVRSEGMTSIAEMAMGRFLTPDFIAANPAQAATLRRQLSTMSAVGYAGCAAAIRDMTLAQRLAEIICPALVVTGAKDVSTPFEGHGEHLLLAISGARHVVMPGAHLAPIDVPEELAAVLLSFISAGAAQG
ncbi:MAG: 3-oxoadipate enol-lactonase [Novosphingobium sp.]|jgi:3-oxoadipate enol-lactonase|uniref:3-oxoadipate enol-lactonase n=1 Tax=Novosphingobium sp. TaxID=1874826 RepID=UPI003017D9EC